MFPGGKDILFEALRVRELEDFFTRLSAHLDGAVDFEDLLVRCVMHSTHELRSDQTPLVDCSASEPGDTLGQLTVDGLPRIIRVATAFLAPVVEGYMPMSEGARLVELLGASRHQLLPRAIRTSRPRRSRFGQNVHPHIHPSRIPAIPH